MSQRIAQFMKDTSNTEIRYTGYGVQFKLFRSTVHNAGTFPPLKGIGLGT